MSAKLHRFATRIAVPDLFALSLEQFESKKLAKVRSTFQKENILKKLDILSLAIQCKAQSHSSSTWNLETLVKFALLTIPEVLPNRDFSYVTLVSEESDRFEGPPCVLEFGSFLVILLKPLFGLPWWWPSRDAPPPPPNLALIWTSSIRGGEGSEANQTELVHFFVNQFFLIVGRKGGWWPNPKVLGHFLPKYWVKQDAQKCQGNDVKGFCT